MKKLKLHHIYNFEFTDKYIRNALCIGISSTNYTFKITGSHNIVECWRGGHTSSFSYDENTDTTTWRLPKNHGWNDEWIFLVGVIGKNPKVARLLYDY